jgi:phosphatidate cytidylyltransferase
LKTRVLTALVLILIVLGVVFCTSPWPFFALIAFSLVLASREAAALTSTDALGVVFGAVTPFAVLLDKRGWVPTGAVASIPLTFLLLGILVAGDPRPWNRFAVGWWIGAPLLSLVWLHNLTATGHLFNVSAPILLAMVPLWAGDTAAIFGGKAFGKHLLAPDISPKKTVEGAVANLLACIAVAIPLAMWLNYSWITGLACGLCAGVLGQAGDLFESALKRRAGVKDSGTLLPGHGGILDRIDSLLFTAPAVAYILLR